MKEPLLCYLRRMQTHSKPGHLWTFVYLCKSSSCSPTSFPSVLSFITIVCAVYAVCVYEVHVPCMVWRPEDSFVELILSFHLYVGPGNGAQVGSLGWQV